MAQGCEVVGVEVVGVDDELGDVADAGLELLAGLGEADLDRAFVVGSSVSLDVAGGCEALEQR